MLWNLHDHLQSVDISVKIVLLYLTAFDPDGILGRSPLENTTKQID